MALQSMSREIEDCIDECIDCHQTCIETLTHCLTMGGSHAEPGHIQMLLDCAEICQMSANFMMRRSPMHNRACEVCAYACDRCAVACEQFADEAMKACAEACRSCAEACRTAAPISMAA